MGSTETTRPAILFVCLGNICRSPMAEGAFRAAAEQAGLEVRVDSAGTADYHIGAAPDPRAIATATAHGIDISGLRGRQVAVSDFREFSHIFALDMANLRDIESMGGSERAAQISMLMDIIPGRAGEPVPDPYHGDEAEFERCWLTINEAVEVLVARLVRDGAEARL